MIRQNIPLGRIMGIPIGLDYSWFLIFALLTWMLAGNYYPDEFKNWPPLLYWFMGAVTAIMLFVSVLLHELGHSVIARRFGIPMKGITLFIFGGVAEMGAAPPNAKSEFHTDKGRIMRGGGGIIPDAVVFPPAVSRLRAVLDASGSFTSLATGYTQTHKISEDFEITSELLDDYRLYLAEHNIQPNVSEWSREQDFIRNRLKTEIFNLTLGVAKGDEIEAQRDPQIQRALEMISAGVQVAAK